MAKRQPSHDLPAEPAETQTTQAVSVAAEEPLHAGHAWREHDLVIRRFHLAGLGPTEIAVVLNSKGLKVKTWAVSETFVRNRLKALALAPNHSRVFYAQGKNVYRPRADAPADRPRTEAVSLPDELAARRRR
jgi:hypothetical protein